MIKASPRTVSRYRDWTSRIHNILAGVICGVDGNVQIDELPEKSRKYIR